MFAVEPVPLPPPAVVRPAGTASLAIPEVATTASDGEPSTLTPGRVRLSVPALLNVHAAPRHAWLEVNGATCTPVDLVPGEIANLTCAFVVRPRRDVTVRLVVAGDVVATWEHSGR